MSDIWFPGKDAEIQVSHETILPPFEEKARRAFIVARMRERKRMASGLVTLAEDRTARGE